MPIREPKAAARARHRQLLALMKSQSGGLDRFFGEMSRELGTALKGYKLKYPNDPWRGNKAIEAKVNRVLAKMGTKYQGFVQGYMERAIRMSNGHMDSMLDSYLEAIGQARNTEIGDAFRRSQAIQGWKSRRVKGLMLSSNVWRIDKQTKQQMETYLVEGLADGRAARKMATDLKQYLKQPDKRFRRVRDPETGKLKLSKPAQAYHPGRGVYRSSYANALRVARNETNLAYRENDYLRRQNMKFVKGIRVNLSPAHPEYDICDELQGDYPKTFRFSGWHPNCLCYTTSILDSKEDFIKRMNGQAVNTKDVDRVPRRAARYLSAHGERLNNLSNKPYFLENFQYYRKTYRLKPSIGKSTYIDPAAAGKVVAINKPGAKPGAKKSPTLAPSPGATIIPGEPRGEFIPATTVPEVETRARQIINGGTVDLTGMELNQANAFLDTLEKEHAFSSLAGLSKLSFAVRGPRRMSMANGWYTPILERITIAKRSLNNKTPHLRWRYVDSLDTVEKHIKEVENTIRRVELVDLGPQYAANKKREITRLKRTLTKYKKKANDLKAKIKDGQEGMYWSMSSKEADGIKAMQTTLIHEIGHYRHFRQLKHDVTGRNGFKSRPITEYSMANYDEYFAEWYTYWRKGGKWDLIPQDLKNKFERLKGLQE